MRVPLLAGNWKMYKTVSEAVDFVKALEPQIAQYASVERVVAPSFAGTGGCSRGAQGLRS
ncbi:MAG: hypothetical protein HC828_18605 [Blastochloris sp.]|nr:hypothetical protein [Blastochloris sp.]